MTTIAYKNGEIAVDSRYTIDSEAGGTRMFPCQKLWRKRAIFQGKAQEMIFATAGEGPSGQLFIEKFGDDKLSLDDLRDTLTQGGADFTILVLCESGLYEVNQWCCFEQVHVVDGCYAIGSGTKAAMGAMLAGKSAKSAVEIAARIDPHTAGPVITMRLTPPKKPKPKIVKEKPITQPPDAHTTGS